MGRNRKPYLEKKTTKSIRIPRKIWHFLEELAKDENSTLTLTLQKIVENHMKKMGK